jgi:drug/metabolite transporter (DMT)-like permease
MPKRWKNSPSKWKLFLQSNPSNKEASLEGLAAPAAHLNQTRLIGLGCALAGAVAFSGKAIVVKLGYRLGVDAITLLMYRMLFALPFFLCLMWWGSRASKQKAPKFKMTGPDFTAVLVLGFFGYYMASFLDFLGLQYISASLERLILYLNPTLVLLLGVVMFGRRLRWQQVAGLAISYGGVVVALWHELSVQGTNVLLGSVLVFLSAISYALYLGYSGQWVQRLGSVRLVGWSSSVACILCILQFLLTRPLAALAVPAEVLTLSLVNAIFCTVIPVMLVMMAIGRIGSALTAQVGMLGPVSTIFFAYFLLGEPFGLWSALGAVLVLMGVAWASHQSLKVDGPS